MSFTVPREDRRIAREALEAIVGELGIEHVATEEAMGKVSIVGAGMRSHPGVAAKVFTVLGEAGVNIEMISTSPIKISCVIAARPRARGRARPSTTRSSSPARTRFAPRIRSEEAAMSPGPRVAVVGATGAVGRIMLEVLASARLPGRRDRSVRLRALGRTRAARRRRRRARCATTRSPASTSRCSRPAAAPRASGRRASRRPAPSSSTTRSPGGWTREVPLVVSEVNPDALERDRPRDRRQPQLHDDA